MTEAGPAAIEAAQPNDKRCEPTAADHKGQTPAKLREQVKKHKKAEEFIAALAPSFQRQYITWIGVAKQPETRRRRAVEAIALLSRGKKLGMRCKTPHRKKPRHFGTAFSTEPDGSLPCCTLVYQV